MVGRSLGEEVVAHHVPRGDGSEERAQGVDLVERGRRIEVVHAFGLVEEPRAHVEIAVIQEDGVSGEEELEVVGGADPADLAEGGEGSPIRHAQTVVDHLPQVEAQRLGRGRAFDESRIAQGGAHHVAEAHHGEEESQPLPGDGDRFVLGQGALESGELALVAVWVFRESCEQVH